MADFSVEGEITLDASQVAAGANQAATALDSLNQIVLTQWWGLQNIGAAFAMFAGAVTAAVGSAINEAVQWEDSMANVARTVTELGEAAFESERAVRIISDGLRDVAAVTPIAASALAEIAAEAGALGIARSDIVEFTKTVGDLAAVTDLTADTASEGMARIAGILQTPASQFENLASAILETGRSTISTEPEIVKLATGLAGIAAQVDWTEADLIGLSATLASLGLPAEMARTAIQKSFIDMQTAISEGGEELQLFAAVSGQTSEEFARAFGQDSMQTFTTFIEGLDNMGRAGQDVFGILRALGITEARQINTLTRLAAASRSASNEGVRLRDNLELANVAFNENAALAEITAARYATFTMQLQMLRNVIDEVQEMFGSAFLPVLQAVVRAAQAFVNGLQAIPGPVRVVYAALVLVSAAIAGIGAAVFLLLPRIVLMRHSLQSLDTAAYQATGAMSALGGQSLATGGQVLTSSTMIAAGFNNIKVASAGTQAAIAGNVAAAGAASTAASKLAKGARFAGKALGILGAVIGIASVGIGIFGAVTGRAARQTEDFGAANEALIAVMKQEAAGHEGAINAWLAHQFAMAGVIPTAQQLGFTLAQLMAFVRGDMTGAAASGMYETISGAMEAGDAKAKELLAVLMSLRDQYKESARVIKLSGDYTVDYADSVGDLTKKINDNTKATKDNRDALEERNQAILDYGRSLLTLRSAEFDAVDAQEAYNDALYRAQNPQEAIKHAELELAQARLSQRRALRDLERAEENLARSREDGRRKLEDAEYDLAEAQYSYEESLDRILDREEALAKLRAGPSAEDLLDATLRLERAHLRLQRAEQGVADAEWFLQYLREEGASARDIEDAELALAEARQEAAESEDELSDSERELIDLRRGADPRELADAERELEKAYRDSERASRNIGDAERELAEVRRRVAEDDYYREAMYDLVGAQLDAEQSAIDLRRAEEDLQSILDGDLWREVARAQLEYEEALYRLAEARTDVQRNLGIIRGEYWDTGRVALEMAKQLGIVGKDAPAAIQKNFADIGSVLSNAVALARRDLDSAIGDQFGGIGGPGGPFGGIGDDIADILGDELDYGFEEGFEEGEKSLWEKIKEWMPELGSSLGAIIGAGIGMLVGGPLGAAIGGAIGTAIGYAIGLITEKFGPQIVNFFKDLKTNTDVHLREAQAFWREKLSGIATTVNEELTNVQTYWREKLTGIKDTVDENLTEVQDFWSDALSDIKSDVDGYLTDVQKFWKTKLSDIKKNTDSTLTEVKDFWGGKLRDIKRDVDTYLEDVKRTWRTKLTDIKTNTDERLEEVKKFWRNKLGDLKKITDERLEETKTFWRNKLGDTKRIVDERLEEVKTTWRTKLTNLKNITDEQLEGVKTFWRNKLGDIVGTVRTKATEIYEKAKTAGRNLINGIKNGISEKWREFTTWLGDKFDSVGKTVERILKLSSPSKLFAYFGEMIVEGMRQGMESQFSNLEKTAGSMADLLQPPLSDLSAQYELGGRGRRGGAAAGAPAGVGAASGDQINVYPRTDADPYEIAREIVWTKGVRRR